MSKRVKKAKHWNLGAAALVSLFIATSASGQTPTTGPSWLEHLRRNMGDTAMGRSSVLLGPSPGEEPYRVQLGPLPPTATLSGADLYRLKCQGCHGPEGHGEPPEINSIIDPVRATSAELVMERMKKNGAEMSRNDVIKLASQSESSLIDRLHKGGKDMPNPGLTELEIHILMPYLKQLAGMRAKSLTTQESQMRVGEHLVKSTCHICHTAVGRNPTPDDIGVGVIPPLSTLTTRVSMEQFVRKVTHGAPLAIGNLALQSRGRMPVFSYISENEAAAAYMYLLAYPPEPEGVGPSILKSAQRKH